MSRSPHAPRIATKGRSAEAIRRHYDTEKTLAARLRGATRDERSSLYRTVYDDLFRLLPDHPQLVRKQSPEQARHKISAQLGLLGPYLRSDAVFLELGAGDCALSLEIAMRVKQVFAVDVSEQIMAGVQRRDNLTSSSVTGARSRSLRTRWTWYTAISSSSTSIPTTWCNSFGVSAACSDGTAPICV